MSRNIKRQTHSRTFFQLLCLPLILFVLGVLFKSCAPKPIQSTHTIERIIEHHTDSIKTTVVNKAIIDSLMIQIAKVKTAKPECDSITQATVDQLLSQLNNRKKSGDNEAGIYYDKLKKMLVIWQKMAQTQNETLATNKEKTDIKTDDKIVEVPVKYIPLWVKILAWIGFGFLLYAVWRIARIFI
ncbi:MAG: hypothetical protein ABI576_14120 [Flavobacterium sp.]